MKRLFFIFIGLMFFTNSGFTMIIESEDFSKIEDYVNKNTLVCIGLDNTLICPVQTLGTRQWLEDRKECLEKNPDISDPDKQALHEWMAIQHVTKNKQVDANNLSVIRYLELLEIPLLIVTDRPLACAHKTLLQIEELGITIRNPFPKIENQLLNNPYHREECLCSLVYQNGVFFTSGLKTNLSMGTAILLLLNKAEQQFDKLIYIDQNLSHLRSTEEACNKNNIPFIGIRYSRQDQEIANYNAQIANLQFERMTSMLSNEHALLVLNLVKTKGS